MRNRVAIRGSEVLPERSSNIFPLNTIQLRENVIPNERMMEGRYKFRSAHQTINKNWKMKSTKVKRHVRRVDSQRALLSVFVQLLGIIFQPQVPFFDLLEVSREDPNCAMLQTINSYEQFC